jgi:hypothetical protein
MTMRNVDSQLRESGHVARCLSRLAFLLWLLPTIGAAQAQNLAAFQEPERVSEASSPLNGAAAAAAINWDEVRPGSIIPHLMPAGDSDDPLEAGFAPQWIEHALHMYALTLGQQSRTVPAWVLAQEIVAQHREPTDRWAYEVDRKIRDTISTDGGSHSLAVWRVFCASHGCLCYLEYPLSPSVSIGSVSSILLHQLRAEDGWGRQLGIKPLDVYYNAVGTHNGYGAWELIYVVRPIET